MTQIALRVDETLAAAIDQRVAQVGVSRNAWIERALTWVVENLPTYAESEVAHQAALHAPADVAGTQRIDLGSDRVDGRKS